MLTLNLGRCYLPSAFSISRETRTWNRGLFRAKRRRLGQIKKPKYLFLVGTVPRKGTHASANLSSPVTKSLLNITEEPLWKKKNRNWILYINFPSPRKASFFSRKNMITYWWHITLGINTWMSSWFKSQRNTATKKAQRARLSNMQCDEVFCPHELDLIILCTFLVHICFSPESHQRPDYDLKCPDCTKNALLSHLLLKKTKNLSFISHLCFSNFSPSTARFPQPFPRLSFLFPFLSAEMWNASAFPVRLSKMSREADGGPTWRR